MLILKKNFMYNVMNTEKFHFVYSAHFTEKVFTCLISVFNFDISE